MTKKFARTHRDLELYKLAFEAAVQVFEVTKPFPVEERFALSNQVRRSSRSVCGNLAEAWRKRRYESRFWPSSMTLKAKLQRLRSGWNSQYITNICRWKREENCMVTTK